MKTSTIELKLAPTVVDEFYQLYTAAFTPLQTKAAARHMLTAAEFAEEMADERIEKHVVWEGERPIALLTLTSDLSAVPWISPQFYQARHPDRAARGVLFYLGYTLVHPEFEGQAIYARLIATVVRRVNEVRGVVAFDVCGYNDAGRGLADGIRGLSRRIDMRLETVDVQSYYEAIFNGPRVPGVERVATPDDAVRTVTLAARPDLAERIPQVLASRWPQFMLSGTPGHSVDLSVLMTHAPQHQVLLLDARDEVLGVGLSTPLRWDGTEAGLPAGWDAMVAAGVQLLEAGETPNAAGALSVTLTPAAAGRGLATVVFDRIKDSARSMGARGLLAPVRPVWKPRYPLVSMEEYLTWRLSDGRQFDPWLRVHLDAGARVLKIAPQSMTITGSVAEWESWTGLKMPASGQYVIPGGLAPVDLDKSRDIGVYSEPNVWVAHRW